MVGGGGRGEGEGGGGRGRGRGEGEGEGGGGRGRGEGGGGGGGGGGKITLKGAGYFTVHFWGQVTSRQHVRCAACVHGLKTFENHFCENLDP